MAEPFSFQFAQNDDQATTIVVNNELKRWAQITKSREGDLYRLTVLYGDLGTGKNRYKTCKLPRIVNNLTNEQAVALANTDLSGKLAHGYTYEIVTVNGQNIYPIL